MSRLCSARLLLIALTASTASAQLTSYPVSSVDIVGDTGAHAVALGVPDYMFVNDFGLGFGGASTDVFDVGETVELAFITPLRNNLLQHDLIVSAFVGGLGAIDNARVQVEASSNGQNFTVIQTFDTESARHRPPPNQWENDFEAVKHFPVEFGPVDNVTHIRLTNIAGTSEGLRLDAVEGLHPVNRRPHAFEIRLERVREPVAQRFKIRIKNIADPRGVPIREIKIDRSASLARLEETIWSIVADGGEFICVENCIMDNGPWIPYSRHVWSTDGVTEAPPGQGLEPGRQAANERWTDFDTDGGTAYMAGFRFTVTFADGFSHTFDYDKDVLKEIGSQYQKYLYFSSSPAQSWNRPVDYYEFVQPRPVVVPPGTLRRT